MRRTLVVLGLVGSLLASSPARAASPPLEDPAGDANGVNDQQLTGLLPVEEQSTAPASVGSADIRSATMRTVWKGRGSSRRPDGLVISLRLEEPPSQQTYYSVKVGVAGTCDGRRSTLNFYYWGYAAGQVATATCEEPDGSSTNDVLHSAWVDEAARTVNWRVVSGMKAGTKLVGFEALTSVFVLGTFDKAYGTGVAVYGR